MKQIFKLSALLLALCFSFVSCQKDYDATPDIAEPATNNPFKGSFTCKIDGDMFIAEQQTATLTDVNGVKTLTVTGIQYGFERDDKNFRSVGFTISNYDGNKKYAVGGNTQVVYTIMVDGYATHYTSNTANANYHVTTTGNYVGTFNTAVAEVGNTSNKVVLTEGKFDIQ